MDETPTFLEILQCLAAHDAEVLVVGGVAGVLWGAPISTFDLDLVYKRSPENCVKLERALSELTACYRDPVGRRIAPDASRLEAGGHHQLSTRAGPLDVLATIGWGRSYETLFAHSQELELAGLRHRVLDLATLIETKAESGRPRDLAALPVLRETLRLSGG